MILGVAFGFFFPDLALTMQPLSTGFIKLIRMIIAPVIFTTVVTGIAGMGDLKRVGRIGLKAFVYFEVMTTLALALGWFVVQAAHPGAGMNADPAQLDSSKLQTQLVAAKAQPTAVEFFLNVIPKSVIGAFAENEFVQVLFISVLFGVGLARAGEQNRVVVNALEQISKAFLQMTAIIIKLAPIAVFGAMSYTIGRFGIASLFPLARLMGCVYFCCIFFIVVFLGTLLKINGLNIFKFIRYIGDELMIVFGTASSEPVLPRMMAKMEALGCSRPLVGIVLPAGYTFNLDGSALYLTIGALFIAQATNTHLTLMQTVTVLGVCILTSKGTAAVVGSAFITLAATLSTLKTIPVEGMILILGVDWFMAEARAMTNLVGNGVATIVLACWENEFDKASAARMLDGSQINEANPPPGGAHNQ